MNSPHNKALKPRPSTVGVVFTGIERKQAVPFGMVQPGQVLHLAPEEAAKACKSAEFTPANLPQKS